MNVNFEKILTAIVIAVALFLPGCASVQESGSGAKTAVQVAALKVIDEDADRAERVTELTRKVRSTLTGDETTSLDKVEANVRDAVDWSSLDSAESLVVNRLIDAVRLEIEKRIDSDVATLDPDEVVAVKRILDWVEEAALMSGAEVSHHDPDPQAVPREEAVLARRASPA